NQRHRQTEIFIHSLQLGEVRDLGRARNIRHGRKECVLTDRSQGDIRTQHLRLFPRDAEKLVLREKMTSSPEAEIMLPRFDEVSPTLVEIEEVERFRLDLSMVPFLQHGAPLDDQLGHAGKFKDFPLK